MNGVCEEGVSVKGVSIRRPLDKDPLNRNIPSSAGRVVGMHSTEMLSCYHLQRSSEGYIFTPVCHSVHRGGIHPAADTPRHPAAYTPGPDTPLGRQPPMGRHLPPADGYCCGRYASYWNALNAFCYHMCSDCGTILEE